MHEDRNIISSQRIDAGVQQDDERLPKAPPGAWLAADIFQPSTRPLPKRMPFPLAGVFQRYPDALVNFRVRDESWQLKSPGQWLTADDLRAAGPHVLATAGHLETLTMRIDVDTEQFLQHSKLNWSFDTLLDKYVRLKSARYIDAHGNTILAQANPRRNCIMIAVHCPPTVGAAPGEFADSPWSVDLSPLRLGKHSKIIAQRKSPGIGEVKGYAIYTSPDAKHDFTAQPEQLESFVEGVEGLYHLFGFSAKEHLDSVYLYPASGHNAYFNPAAPRTLFASRSMFSSHTSAFACYVTGFHEAAHAIDHILNLSSEQPSAASDGIASEFYLLHNKNLEFLRMFNEANFLPGVPFGGHAEDSPGEFLASFLNTLNHPNLVAALQDSSPLFREHYLTIIFGVLRSLRIADESVLQIPENCPLRARLRELLDLPSFC